MGLLQCFVEVLEDPDIKIPMYAPYPIYVASRKIK